MRKASLAWILNGQVRHLYLVRANGAEKWRLFTDNPAAQLGLSARSGQAAVT
jgi:hypothetical protein